MSPSKLPPDVIQVYARGFGFLQWICPTCHYIHGNKPIDPRNVKVECTYRWDANKRVGMCRGNFRIGFVFKAAGTTPLERPAPYNAWLMGSKLRGHTTNWLAPALTTLDKTPATAKFLGSLEYICPTCQTWNRERISQWGGVTCTGCQQTWIIGVIFHKPNGYTRKVYCPRDWSVSREFSGAAYLSPGANTPGTPGTPSAV